MIKLHGENSIVYLDETQVVSIEGDENEKTIAIISLKNGHMIRILKSGLFDKWMEGIKDGK